MDITSLLGPGIALAFIIGGMILEGGHVGSIIQITAALIVLGGTFGAMMVAYPLQDMIGAVKAIEAIDSRSMAAWNHATAVTSPP